MAFLTSETFNSLDELLLFEVKDLYDAEQRLVKALPKMEEKATNPELKKAFRQHLEETKQHATRLKQVFEELDESPEAETCEAMKGLIEEGESIVNADGDKSVIDAALIAAAQRVEHYEISAYGSARAFAKQLGLSRVASLLGETLDEESSADAILSRIAESSVNQESARGRAA